MYVTGRMKVEDVVLVNPTATADSSSHGVAGPPTRPHVDSNDDDDASDDDDCYDMPGLGDGSDDDNDEDLDGTSTSPSDTAPTSPCVTSPSNSHSSVDPSTSPSIVGPSTSCGPSQCALDEDELPTYAELKLSFEKVNFKVKGRQVIYVEINRHEEEAFVKQMKKKDLL
jgi:hypothetical protein